MYKDVVKFIETCDQKQNLSNIDSKTGKILKSFDGKVMTPKGWKAPNLKWFLK